MKNTLIIAASFALLSCGGAVGDDKADARQINIDPAEFYRFTVSLLELREDTQHKHLAEIEIRSVALILRAARYEKKAEYSDVARTAYISRYQFISSYRGGTPKSGKSESGMLTIDCKTLYWNDGIFTLRDEDAQRLVKIFPKPVNPATKSERPEAKPTDK